MLACRGERRAAAPEPDVDPIGELEAYGLAVVVQHVDEITGDAFEPQLLVDADIDGNRHCAVLDQCELLVRGRT